MTDEYTDVEIYSKEDYLRDERDFSEAESHNKVDWASFSRLMTHDLCVNTNVIDTCCLGDISFRDLDHALKHPSNGWRVLLRVSDYLMTHSPHYYRLNMMYSNMALFCWGIDMYDVDEERVNYKTAKQVYNKLSSKLEEMHLKHEFSKIMKCLPQQDIYCGLVVENSTDFFFQKIDYRICRLYQIQDGLYNFQINLSAINAKELGAYPDYVQDAYINYKNNENNCSNWYLPPADKQICVKLNSQWSYPYPMLISLVRDILDLNTYKKLKLQSARTDNYKAIVIKVPIDEGTVDKPLLSPETLGVFAEINRESMSDDIGLIHTLGSEGKPISFKDSNNTTNNVSDSVNDIYNGAGVTQEAFNGSSSGTAVKTSIENSSGFVYGVYRQLERWVNRFIKLRKYNKKTFKFSFYLLDETIFNRDDVTKRYRELSTLGFPVIDKIAASIDITPSRMAGAIVVHNEIFDYYNKFKPLSSSYNASVEASSVSSGRPTNEEKGEVLSEEGQKTADKEKNDR